MNTGVIEGENRKSSSPSVLDEQSPIYRKHVDSMDRDYGASPRPPNSRRRSFGDRNSRILMVNKEFLTSGGPRSAGGTLFEEVKEGWAEEEGTERGKLSKGRGGCRSRRRRRSYTDIQKVLHNDQGRMRGMGSRASVSTRDSEQDLAFIRNQIVEGGRLLDSLDSSSGISEDGGVGGGGGKSGALSPLSTSSSTGKGGRFAFMTEGGEEGGKGEGERGSNEGIFGSVGSGSSRSKTKRRR